MTPLPFARALTTQGEGSSRNRAGRGAAGCVAVAIILSVATGATGQALRGVNPLGDKEILGLLGFAGLGVVGALVLARHPGHALGRVWSFVGVAACLVYAVDEYARYSVTGGHDLPGELFAAWLQNWLWFPPIAPVFVHTFLFFPDGRLPSPRWRIVAWVGTAAPLLMTLYFMLNRDSLDGFDAIPNPTGVIGQNSPLAPLVALCLFATVAAALASVASLFVRYRRLGYGGRQQIKIVAIASVLMFVLLGTAGLSPVGGSEALGDLLFGISVLIFPVACGVAIIRHGLFDIDVVINRALVYGSLTATLAFAYLTLVVSLQQLLAPVIRQSDVAVAASTLAVAALFRPLRMRIQALIDRRFYRRKYDAARALAGFSSRLRDEVEIETLTSDVLAVVHQTVEPARVSLWLKPAGSP